MKKTLATDLNIVLDNTSRRVSNVVVRVIPRSRGGVLIDINDSDVRIVLNEAERIALIAALGGTK